MEFGKDCNVEVKEKKEDVAKRILYLGRDIKKLALDTM